MKKFNFPLHSVLQWRTARLEEEERRLQRLTLKQHQTQAEIAWNNGQRSRINEDLQATSSVTSIDLAGVAAYQRHLVQCHEALATHAQHIAQQIEDRRESLLDAKRELETCHRLREKAVVAWRKELEVELDGDAAELYLAQWHRRKADGVEPGT
jgi:flagellar export protein FliJ